MNAFLATKKGWRVMEEKCKNVYSFVEHFELEENERKFLKMVNDKE